MGEYPKKDNMRDFLATYFTFNNVAPFGAGSPAALVLAVNLYHVILDALGTGWGWAAWIVAACSMATMIWIEATGYKQAARALALHEIKAAIWSVLAALFCSAMVVYGVWSGISTRALISSLGYSVAGYILIAIYAWMGTKQEMRREAVEVGAAQTQNQVALLQAQAEVERQKASAERAKARQVSGQKVTLENRKVSESFGTDWRHVPATDREKISQMTTKQISETYRVSERTALNWQTYSREK